MVKHAPSCVPTAYFEGLPFRRGPIPSSLFIGRPRDLRRWIDDELVETLAKEMEAEDEQAV